jgi:hypothetical protein
VVAENQWIANPKPRNVFWHFSPDSLEEKSSTSINVDLPGDSDPLTDYWVYGGNPDPGPQIAPPPAVRSANGNPLPIYSLTEGSNVSLLVRGRNLWRNAEVYIGNQRANTVDYNSDMDGLYATFGKLAAPSLPPGVQGADLTVVTAFGADTLRNAVVVKAAQTTAIAPFASLASQYISPDHPLTLAIDSGKLPSGTDLTKIQVRLSNQSNSTQSVTLDPVPPIATPSGGVQVSFRLPTTQPTNPPTWWTVPTVVDVALVLPAGAAPTGTPQGKTAAAGATQGADSSQGTGSSSTLSVAGSLVYLSDKAQETLTIDPDTIASANGKAAGALALKLNNAISADIFFQAFPALRANDGSLTMNCSLGTAATPIPLQVTYNSANAPPLSVAASELSKLVPKPGTAPALYVVKLSVKSGEVPLLVNSKGAQEITVSPP